MKVQLFHIAKACHNVNRALCQAQGDDSQVPFDEAPEWQRASALNGVALHVSNPGMSPAASHEAWLAQKTREGWGYGKVKDVEKKLHPCFLPYDKLPSDQKAKDYIFKAVVAEFAALLGANAVAEAVAVAEAFAAQGAEPVKAEAQAEPIPTAAAASDQQASGDAAGAETKPSTDSSSTSETTASDTSTGSTDPTAATTDSASDVTETQPVAETAAAE